MASEGADMTTRVQRFGAYFSDSLRGAGYDIDSLRGGARVAVAKRVGVSKSTVSRWIDGDAMPSPEFFEPLADLIGVRLREFLVDSGIISAESLTEINDPKVRSRPITPTQALDDLAIRNPGNRAVIAAAIAAARKLEDGQGELDGGAAAER
jgi:transcriptional regulator with XRE-family HTH domain